MSARAQKIALPLYCAACCAISPAIAETSMPHGGYIRGDVGIERNSVFGSSETVFSGRLDFGISPEQISSDLGPFGVHFALEGMDGRGADDLQAFYASVSYTGSFGRFSIGAPRPVTDDGYFDPHLFLGSTSNDFDLGQFTRSWVSNAYLYWETDDRPVGARWDGKIAETKIGVSYNQIDDLRLKSWNLAVRHDFDTSDSVNQFAIYGGIEWSEFLGNKEVLYRLGLEAKTADFNTGLRWDRLELPYKNTVTAYAEYKLVPNATVGIDAMYSDGFSGTMVYGLNGKYRFHSGGWLNVHIGSNIERSDYFYGAGLGQHF